jgi:hypothetical protein
MKKLLLIAALVFTTHSALACSYITNTMIFFPFGSAELSPQVMKQIQSMGFGPPGQRLPAGCQSFELVGHTDTAEAAEADGNLSIARAEVVQRALEQQRGGRVVRISGRPDQLLVVTGPAVKEPQNRRVTVQWTSATKGRTRCDPVTENDQSGPLTTCGIPKYAACYFELEDGTVCNFRNVPNPNPAKYSVVLGSE